MTRHRHRARVHAFSSFHNPKFSGARNPSTIAYHLGGSKYSRTRFLVESLRRECLPRVVPVCKRAPTCLHYPRPSYSPWTCANPTKERCATSRLGFGVLPETVPQYVDHSETDHLARSCALGCGYHIPRVWHKFDRPP